VRNFTSFYIHKELCVTDHRFDSDLQSIDTLFV